MSVLSLIGAIFNNKEFSPFILCLGLSVTILLDKLGYLEFLKIVNFLFRYLLLKNDSSADYFMINYLNNNYSFFFILLKIILK